jgi:hypothetical protein
MPMSPASTDKKNIEPSQTREPAKGGTESAKSGLRPSGDSPKPHGDKLQHAVDEAADRDDN